MKAYRILRIARICTQVIVASAIAISLVLGIGCAFAKMQIVTAVLSATVVWLALWAVATLLFGRIYCSTVCPTGALIDLMSAITRRRGSRYRFRQPIKGLRDITLVAFIICGAAGISVVTTILDPYCAFSRIVLACARPAGIGLGGLLAAAATFLIITITAWRRGRLICNTICPVGTFLGGLSQFSLYRIDINTDICTGCGKCADVCPSECINLNDHTVDVTRCVVCFDCANACGDGAITYRRGRHRLVMPMMQRTLGNAGVSPANASQSSAQAANKQTSVTSHTEYATISRPTQSHTGARCGQK